MTAPLPIPLLTRWSDLCGHYEGEGMNHMNESFWGQFDLSSVLDHSLLQIRFKALERKPPSTESLNEIQAFHDEYTWITEDILERKIALWTVSTNTPGVLRHHLTNETQDGSYVSSLLFALGDPNDQSRFRQSIQLAARKDGALEYIYCWGVPHEEFGVRSRCLLKRVV